MNVSLDEGATDGKYRKNRPDSTVSGDSTMLERKMLHPSFYGTFEEAPVMLRPDGVVASRIRRS
jgi:hypothetical protein